MAADSPHALILRYRARPGRREKLVEVWRRHMPEAVQGNPGHQEYLLVASYADPDVLVVLQQYRDAAAAQAFLADPAYLAYLEESGPLLAGPPEAEPVAPLWSRSAGTTR